MDLRIIQLSEFIGLNDRLASAALHIAARIDANNAAVQAAENAFSHYGLLWPECLDALDYALASDLQVEGDGDEWCHILETCQSKRLLTQYDLRRKSKIYTILPAKSFADRTRLASPIFIDHSFVFAWQKLKTS
jgi:hypothetical protein